MPGRTAVHPDSLDFLLSYPHTTARIPIGKRTSPTSLQPHVSMANKSESALSPARIAGALRIIGWLSFWIQIVLGVVSAIILLFAGTNLRAPSPNPNVPTSPVAANPGTGAGLFLHSWDYLLCLAVLTGHFVILGLPANSRPPIAPEKQIRLMRCEWG